MPGVNPPNSEYLQQFLAGLHNRLRALETQQQLVFTNAAGETIISLGAVPQFPGDYGIVGWSGVTGNACFVCFDTTIPDGSGRRQTNVGIARDDGSTALICADLGTVPNHPHQQALQWYDRSGNVVIADDTVSGTGLARPHVNGGLVLANTNTATWPSTTSATMATIMTGYYEVTNPTISLAIWLEADTSTTGQFEIQVNGTQIGTTQTVTGAFLVYQPNQLALPAGVNIGNLVTVNVLAARTAGTGTVRAAMLNWRGDQSP